ncbi:MAG: class I SAM-dependent methyltransferase [Anaerolineales bacterium]|nr:class I SAM-dependent methyltransferase [Anaerolineales bacterium]
MRAGDHFIQAWRMHAAARWIPEDSRVLDIGCHQGELFKWLGDRITPSVGIDPLYKETTPPDRHQFFPWTFHGRLPFPESSFDVIALLATIEHMPDKSAVAKESWRLLRPGGRVVITFPSLLVDRIISVLASLHIVDGMSLEEHHGFSPNELPDIFEREGFGLKKWGKFQLGLNNLFVFERV